MKRRILLSFVFAICLISIYGCTDSANSKIEEETSTRKDKAEFIEEFEEKFEEAVANDSVKSFLSEIYPNYVFDVNKTDDGMPILDVSTPSNLSVPGYRLTFKKDAKIFLNGQPSKLSDIRKGDYISVCGRFSPLEMSPSSVEDIDFAVVFRQ